jgi:N-acetylmuramoyl-L-alanine amidase
VFSLNVNLARIKILSLLEHVLTVKRGNLVLRLFTLWVMACFSLVASTAALSAQDVAIKGIRFGQNGETTRVVLDLSSGAQPQIFLLSAPNRIVIDFPNSGWDQLKSVPSSGLVAGYRHGLFSSSMYRIVLDLKAPAIINKSFPLPARGGYANRFVIDLKPAAQARFNTAVKATRKNRVKAPLVTATVATPPRKRKDGKRVIVVDAGHGGVDPGTLGRGGANEKTITLKISKAIKRQLESTGRYKVYLTRSKDIYIPHRRRFGKAKQVGADLFLSIHVDSIKNSKVRGGTVYTLNERASDKEAARLAAKENKSDILAGVDLPENDSEVSNILIELAQRAAMNSSARFAEILVPQMRRQVTMHKRGHRFANLLVLKSPDVPSVLIETGYITNKSDARMLNSKDGARRISRAVTKAVDQYFQTLVAEGR